MTGVTEGDGPHALRSVPEVAAAAALGAAELVVAEPVTVRSARRVAAVIDAIRAAR